MEKKFTKQAALDVLAKRATRIAEQEKFNRGLGTAQLAPRNVSHEEQARLDRAVQYGRMRAFEEFAEAIRDGFRFDT